MNLYQTKLSAKLKEALKAVLPIIGIVLVLSFTIAPIPPSILLLFLFGAVLLVVGMMFFTLGAELSMTPMGEKIGTKMANSRHIGVVLLLCFMLGFVITVSEPDLQVLAEQVPSIPNRILIMSVAGGVGLFLVVVMLRMLLSKSLSALLIVFYRIVFVLAFFIPKDFLTVAFDSGGVTTGPMTVPFIMALGVGFAAVRSDRHAEDDSFGLVALCSVGPILAVLLLGLLYHPEDTGYVPAAVPDVRDSVELWKCFAGGFPAYIKEIAVSLLPITAFFALFQIISLKLSKRTLLKIVIGIVYTYIGLVLFLTGVNVGFMPAGNYLGEMIAGLPYRVILVPIGMVIGYFLVKAEPAVYVLMEQVEEITSGAIPGRAMGTSLSLGVAVSVGLAAIYFSFVTWNTWKHLRKELYQTMHIEIPGRGIAFLIPLSSIGGKKALHYLTVGQEVEIEEESTLKQTDFELLVAVANAGYMETIMDAARSAHAPGGTVVHAKGTGMEHARKFLGISLAEEKEMIFIVVRSGQKNEIMKAIMEQAGTKSPAGAIVFSLPVTGTAGLHVLEEEDD